MCGAVVVDHIAGLKRFDAGTRRERVVAIEEVTAPAEVSMMFARIVLSM